MAAAVKRDHCATGAVVGVVLGIAGVAYAQEPAQTAATVAASASDVGLMLELLRSGGLPAVLGVLGWLFGRGGLPVKLTLDTDDRKAVDRLSSALEGAAVSRIPDSRGR
jgi:hypothetical protein